MVQWYKDKEIEKRLKERRSALNSMTPEIAERRKETLKDLGIGERQRWLKEKAEKLDKMYPKNKVGHPKHRTFNAPARSFAIRSVKGSDTYGTIFYSENPPKMTIIFIPSRPNMTRGLRRRRSLYSVQKFFKQTIKQLKKMGYAIAERRMG